MELKTLCATYAPLSPHERLERLFEDFDRVLVTSSFGTTSAILLHHLHKVNPHHPVYFIDTTYHFPQTHAYRRQLSQMWKLNVIHVHPSSIENLDTLLKWTWTYAPDECCEVNKVEPMNELKSGFEVWVSGMIGRSTRQRGKLDIFAHDGSILRFYPFLDMTPQEAEWYRLVHELPRHPLEEMGYGSVGCTHCTQKGAGRSGRWKGKGKTECGLHNFKAG